MSLRYSVITAKNQNQIRTDYTDLTSNTSKSLFSITTEQMWAGGIPTQGRAERGKEKEVDKLKIHTTHMKCMRKVNYISSSANILIKLQIQIHAHQPFYFFSRKTKKTARTYKYACDSFAQERVDNSSPFNVVLLPLIPIHLSLSIG